MSDLNQFKNSGGSVPGDLRLFIAGAGAPVMNLQGQDWLQTGFLATYDAAKHSRLLAKFPGLGVKALPAAKAAPSGYIGFNTIFKIGANYVRFSSSSIDTNNWDVEHYSTDLISWSGVVGLGDVLAVRGVASIAGYVVAAVCTNSSMGFASSNSGNSWGYMGGGNFNVNGLCIASDGSKAIGVFKGDSTDSTSLKETTNGTSFTDRTGAGGSVFVVRGLHYSTAAAAFLFIGDSAINKAANGYTQTACTLPAGSAFYNDGLGMQQLCASSPTATIILMSNGKLLHTTDGTTFTHQNFFDVFGEVDVSKARMVWDGTRFVIAVANAGTARPMFLYSTTGLTGSWQRSFACEDLTAASPDVPVVFGLSYTDNKLLLSSGAASTNPNATYDVTGFPQAAAPDYVGAFTKSASGPASYYVRLK